MDVDTVLFNTDDKGMDSQPHAAQLVEMNQAVPPSLASLLQPSRPRGQRDRRRSDGAHRGLSNQGVQTHACRNLQLRGRAPFRG